MFNVRFLVRPDETSPIVEIDFETLAQDLLHGRCSPFAFVFDMMGLSHRSWARAYEHPYLRPLVLGRATLPSILVRIEWVGQDGAGYWVPSREALAHAVQAGYATADTRITVYGTETWFAASAQEVLPRDESNSWGVGKTLLALAAGAAAAGAVAYGVRRYQYNHEPVSLRDPAVRAELYDRDEGVCGLCGVRIRGPHFHLDHKDPRVRGGEDNRANLHVTHPLCNLRKGALTVSEFHARYGAPR